MLQPIFTSQPMRIVIPYVDGKLHPSTREWGEANGATFADVSGDRDAYFWLLRELWAAGESFLVVEHDIVPPAGAVASLAACAEPWCGFPYPYGAVSPALSEQLGCTRFSEALLASHPGLLEQTAAKPYALDFAVSSRDYYRLADRLAMALYAADLRFHCHQGEVQHHHDAGDIFGMNSHAYLQLFRALRHWTLAVDRAADDEARLAEALTMRDQTLWLIDVFAPDLTAADRAEMMVIVEHMHEDRDREAFKEALRSRDSRHAPV